MSPVDPSGVIGPASTAGEAVATMPAAGTSQRGPLPDVPLFQLPADIAPFEPPAYLVARKEFEQGATPVPGGIPAGMSGTAATEATTILGGHPGPDAASGMLGGTSGLDAARGVLDGRSALDSTQGVLDGRRTALDSAQAVLDGGRTALDSAHGTLDGARAALDSALYDPPGTLADAQAALARAGLAPGALPPLLADPVQALLSGMALPAIPGLDALFTPFLDLLNGFGTGVLGAVNPTTLLSQSSKFIEGAVQIGTGALKTVETLWQGTSGTTAQAAGQEAQSHGAETAQRGFDISALTEQAAAVVQRGNLQLTAIAQSFAAQATAMAPVALTPPGQAALIASATEHLGAAVAVVNATRGELSTYTAQLSGVLGPLLGRGGGPNPAEVAQSLAQNVGQPILSQAQELLKSGIDQATKPAGTGPIPANSGDLDTKAAGLGGGGGGAGGGGAGGSGGVGGLAAKPGGPGSSIPGGKLAPAAGSPFGSGAPGAPGVGGMPPGGYMGAPYGGAAGQRGTDDNHTRTVQPHHNHSGEAELTGNLGPASPEVIGDTATADGSGDHDATS
ncbi:hypothetical protein IU501_20270 [Nocardia otitidiscaviarum]|uniref:hypothetical protein n=1 Tax=Nocardia otitidiscaviarum TaxID=1823 RepID=UPI0005B88FC8|nr:hypothetical protein [Nocardia otitidiscaviarum]MBF6135324.1 hypothetical protein [Nocardia otitidiscaviarum]MBF6487145.1 hypothetical protein [Nocardia otitidiscaviarum]